MASADNQRFGHLLILELKRLSNHHLNFKAFTRRSWIDSGHQAFGPEAHPQACAPFHVLMQIFDVPIRRHPADFDKRYKLQPLDPKVFLQPGPAVKRIPGFAAGCAIDQQSAVHDLGCDNLILTLADRQQRFEPQPENVDYGIKHLTEAARQTYLKNFPSKCFIYASIFFPIHDLSDRWSRFVRWRQLLCCKKSKRCQNDDILIHARLHREGSRFKFSHLASRLPSSF